jgi:plasmid stabilization system protein ParE
MTSSIRIDYSQRAIRNIEEVLHYTLDTWGEYQADVYKGVLAAAFERLSVFPDLGHPAEGKAANIRILHREHHNIHYRRVPERMVILRIVSPRRGKPM